MPDPTPTASVVLIDAIITEIEDALPDLLLAAGLPAVAEWTFGTRGIVPTTRTPQVQVDLASAPQYGNFGLDLKRRNNIVVIALLAAPDEDTLHRYLLGYGDCIIAALEGIAPPWAVTGADTTPSFSPQGSNRLFRAVAIEAERVTLRQRGAV